MSPVFKNGASSSRKVLSMSTKDNIVNLSCGIEHKLFGWLFRGTALKLQLTYEQISWAKIFIVQLNFGKHEQFVFGTVVKLQEPRSQSGKTPEIIFQNQCD